MIAQSHDISSFPPHINAIVNPPGSVSNPDNIKLKKHLYVKPVLTREAFRLMVDNYKVYISKYNKKLAIVNRDIKNHNKMVDTYSLQNPVTKNKRLLLALFIEKHNHKKAVQYNQSVDDFNQIHGYYFKKRTFATVKPPSEQVFTALLHAYAVQLSKRNITNKLWGKTVATTLQKLEINPHEIINHERQRVVNLPLCTKTIANHRNRLEEAGVLIEKTYHGTKRPTRYSINPEILVIVEGKAKKSQKTANQPITQFKKKVLPHNNSSTRPFIKQLEKKGIVNNSDDKENALHLTSYSNFYKSTKPQVPEKSKLGAPKNVKVAPKTDAAGPPIVRMPALDDQQPNILTTSAEWLRRLERPFDLAKKLANGEFNYYRPLPTGKLQEQIPLTDLTNDEFREIILQDFIKSSAQLWRNNQGSAGSWGEAIRDLYFKSATRYSNGKSKTKSELYDLLMQWRYRLKWASQWFDKRQWKGVRYPNVYFDPNRNLPGDVCWAYTKKVWSKKLKQQQKVAEINRRKKVEARRRKDEQTQYRAGFRRMDNAIKKFLNGTYSEQELTRYVTMELPQNVQVKFADRLQKLQIRNLA